MTKRRRRRHGSGDEWGLAQGSRNALSAGVTTRSLPSWVRRVARARALAAALGIAVELSNP